MTEPASTISLRPPVFKRATPVYITSKSSETPPNVNCTDEIDPYESANTESDEEELLLSSWHHRAKLGDEARVPYWEEEHDIQNYTLKMQEHDALEDECEL